MYNSILTLGLGLIVVGFIVLYYGGLKLLKGWQSMHRWAHASSEITEFEALLPNPFH